MWLLNHDFFTIDDVNTLRGVLHADTLQVVDGIGGVGVGHDGVDSAQCTKDWTLRTETATLVGSTDGQRVLLWIDIYVAEFSVC